MRKRGEMRRRHCMPCICRGMQHQPRTLILVKPRKVYISIRLEIEDKQKRRYHPRRPSDKPSAERTRMPRGPMGRPSMDSVPSTPRHEHLPISQTDSY